MEELHTDEIPVFCAHDELISIASVVGNPRNPNTHPASQIELLAKIIAAQGWRAPITVSRRSGFVVRGHGRLAAARALGVSSVPVDFQDYESEAAEWADLVADNRIAELAEPDLPMLADLLQELDNGDFDMDLTGFAFPDLERLLTSLADADAEFDDEEVPEPPVEPVTKTGDLWLLGDHRVLCGDATKSNDVERLMGGRKAVCMWTDPPYGVEYVGKTKSAKRIENDDVGGLEGLLTSAFGCAVDACKSGSPWYCAHPAGGNAQTFEECANAVGMRIHQGLVWTKDVLVLGHSDYHYQHEPILYGYMPGQGRSGRGKHEGSRWFGDNSQTSVFDVPRPKRSEEHPTMKPVALVVPMLVNSTPAKGLVFDPFLGSGSTLIAAEHLGRVCYGLELNPAYCDVIVQRWENVTGQKAVLEAAERSEAHAQAE
jgi:DNA modification methylase